MKRVFLVGVALLTFVSCAVTIPPYPTRMVASMVDYTEYNDCGFFVSPFASIDGYDYVPVCTHSIRITTEEEFYSNELLGFLVGKALLNDANGILNIQVDVNIRSAEVVEYFISGDMIRFVENSPVGKMDLSKLNQLIRNNHGIKKLINTAQNKSYDYKAMVKACEKQRYFYRDSDRNILVYDPEVNGYIYERDFIKKYGVDTLQRIKDMQWGYNVIPDLSGEHQPDESQFIKLEQTIE